MGQPSTHARTGAKRQPHCCGGGVVRCGLERRQTGSKRKGCGHRRPRHPARRRVRQPQGKPPMARCDFWRLFCGWHAFTLPCSSGVAASAVQFNSSVSHNPRSSRLVFFHPCSPRIAGYTASTLGDFEFVKTFLTSTYSWLWLIFAGLAHAQEPMTLTFDEFALPVYGETFPVTNGYGSLQWSNFYVLLTFA